MRIAAIQMHSEISAISKNVSQAEELIREAAANKAGLVMLPELFASGYFCSDINPNHFAMAETVTGPLITRMKGLAQELGIWLLVSFFERDQRVSGRHYNTVCVIKPNGEVAGRVSKRYLPLGPTTERYYFRPGSDDTPCFDTGDFKFGIIICYERHFSEIARLEVLKGAEALLVISSIPRSLNRSPLWPHQLITMAATNTCFLAVVNSCGGDGQFGESMSIGPDGSVLGQMQNEEGILYAEINSHKVQEARIHNPILRDVRRDILQRILELT